MENQAHTPLISIIVPVYNVEKFLPRCIESILKQTYENLEIILVDDGSTDASGELCDNYEKQDQRIIVIHKANGGLSDARNVGMDIMHGEYVSFIDSDDYVADNYVEILCKMIYKNKNSISMCLWQKFYNEEKPAVDTVDIQKSQVYSHEDALANMLYRKNINAYACAKLYPAIFFKDIRFPKGKLFEDLRTTYKIIVQAEKIIFNPARLYFYYQRTGSIVNSAFTKLKMEQLIASEEILQFVDENYPSIHNAAVSKCFISAADLYRRIPDEKQFYLEKKYLIETLKRYRKIVFLDKHNKILTRIIACAALINIHILNYGGQIYQWSIKHKLLRLKHPI